jgi:Domain of unknown function (DUF4386)
METTTAPPAPMSPDAADQVRRTARAAGVLYVIIVVFGLFAEVGVRSRLIVPDDPAATARNIVDSAWLFRAGFAADLVVFLADVALAVLLYRLLEPINRTMSLLAAAFRLTQTAIIGLNLLHMFDALRILDQADYLGSIGSDGVEALALSSLESHRYGYILGLTFFGAATLIIGRMAIGSQRMPTAMGAILMVAGAGYVVDAAMFFLVAGYDGAVSPIVLAPAVVAEAWFALWLLTRAGRSLTGTSDDSLLPHLPAATPVGATA